MKLDKNDDNLHEVLQVALVIPYLPAKNWIDQANNQGVILRGGLTILREKIDNIDSQDETVLRNLQKFRQYMERFWGPMAEIVSVNGRARKTTNCCENCNRRAKQAIGIKQPLWTMLGNRRAIISYYFLIFIF